MSISGSKKRRLDCGELDVGSNAFVGNDLIVGGDVNVTGSVTAGSYSGGTITPISLSLPNGSASAPPLRFTSSTNSGYFWDTAGTAGQAWPVGGSKKLKLNSSVLTSDVDIKHRNEFNDVRCFIE